MVRTSFKMQSFWTTLIALAFGFGIYAQESANWRILSVIAMAATAVIIVGRFLVLKILVGMFGDGPKREDLPERIVMIVALVAAVATVRWLPDRLAQSLAVLLPVLVIAAIGRNTHDLSVRSVSDTQVSLFYGIPVAACVMIVGAYFAGALPWFCVASAIVATVGQMFYAWQLDDVEAKAPSNVIALVESEHATGKTA